jgi:hypothetical protein
MTDVIFLLASVCFVLLCVAYISWCDRIIGNPPGDPEAVSAVAAGSTVSGERVS